MGFANLAHNTGVPIWGTGDVGIRSITVAGVLHGACDIALVPFDRASTQGFPTVANDSAELWIVLGDCIIDGTVRRPAAELR
jgi:hypothetical protein